MKSAFDIGTFGAFLTAHIAEVHRAAQLGLRDAAEVMMHDARARLGTYQEAAGPFPAWPDLADLTQTLRSEQGHSADEPLLVTGELRDAIGYSQSENKAVVGVEHREVGGGGTGDESRDIGGIALDMEYGTHSGGRGSHGIPERPFLGPTGFTKGREAAHIVAHAVGEAIAGRPHTKHTPHSASGAEDIPF